MNVVPSVFQPVQLRNPVTDLFQHKSGAQGNISLSFPEYLSEPKPNASGATSPDPTKTLNRTGELFPRMELCPKLSAEAKRG